jgi:hypothetical protein
LAHVGAEIGETASGNGDFLLVEQPVTEAGALNRGTVEREFAANVEKHPHGPSRGDPSTRKHA